MKQPRIKLGEPQPVPCANCGDKMGYQTSTRIIKVYTDMFLPDGESDGGFWSEYGKEISADVSAYCSNCGEKLKFKIER